MEKIQKPEWWAYAVSIGFLIMGVYYLRVWRKSINPKASIGEKSLGEWFNLITAIAWLVAGIVTLIIEVYQGCTGWIAK